MGRAFGVGVDYMDAMDNMDGHGLTWTGTDCGDLQIPGVGIGLARSHRGLCIGGGENGIPIRPPKYPYGYKANRRGGHGGGKG